MKNGALENSVSSLKSSARVNVTVSPDKSPTVYTPFHLLCTPEPLELTPSLTSTRLPVPTLTPSTVSVSALASNPPSPSASTRVLFEAVEAIVKEAV